MNTSYAFRSHLMQQFAASARNQAKPPLAIIGWLSEDDRAQQRFSTATNTASASTTSAAQAGVVPPVLSSSGRDLSSIRTSVLHRRLSTLSQDSSRYEERFQVTSGQTSNSEFSQRLFSSLSEDDNEEEDEVVSSHRSSTSTLDQLELSVAFQDLLQTRRTSSFFGPPAAPPKQEASYWRDAMERAVLCGYNAPNHKRTEPFTFKRMVGPSEKTERLANIAYQVSLRQQQQASHKTGASEEQMDEKAAKKRNKWSQIPAFLVTLLTSKDPVVDSQAAATMDEYDQFPFAPPVTERGLEDYAAASAAVQNVLLSLHAEHVASKWVTGPVIQTPAFRELVEASPHDRVVSLVMIGHPDETKRIPRRRRRRELHGDVLVDL